MRTTVIFDDEVYARLQEEARRRGQSLRVVLNDLVRAGLVATQPRKRVSLTLPVFPMGLREEDLSYDNVAELTERLDGPLP